MTHSDITILSPNAVLWDKGPSAVKGLHVRAFITKKVFYYYYRIGGKQRKVSLGDFPSLTLQKARDLATQMWAHEYMFSEQPSELTLAHVFDHALKFHFSKDEFLESGYQKQVAHHWEHHLKAKFGATKLQDIRAPLVRDWMQSLVETPSAANHAFRLLSKLFSYAEEREWRSQNTNPCRIVKEFKNKKRNRYATEEEIKRIGQILTRLRTTRPRETAFIYLLIYTGARPSTIERAKRSEIQRYGSGDRAFALLRRSGKTGEEVIHIPPEALRILDDAVPEGDREGAAATLTGVKNPTALWKEIRKEAGCEDLWIRDWRRTFATTGMGEGFAMSSISEVLGHASVQTTKIYAKLAPSHQVETVQKTAAKLEKLLHGK